MKKFAIIVADEVIDYRRFFWTTKWDDYRRILVKLVGFEIYEIGIQPIYQPLLSFKNHNGVFHFEIQFSRWVRLILQMNKKGVKGRWEDLKKKYNGE